MKQCSMCAPIGLVALVMTGVILIGCETMNMPTPVTGDAVAGAITYVSNCAACHGVNGTGGSGPNIMGTSAADITAELGGTHAGGPFPGLTEQDRADIAAFLAL